MFIFSLYDHRSEKICDIWKEDEDKVVVSCHKSGVKVKSDGLDVSVEVGAFVTENATLEPKVLFSEK